VGNQPTGNRRQRCVPGLPGRPVEFSIGNGRSGHPELLGDLRMEQAEAATPAA
jgi:hypothetical protein